MATPKKDPLDTLQLAVNDVLVQTGKALRASRKDAKGNPAQQQVAVQSKLPDTLQTFHAALDELEADIVRAKSVLLRDLNQLRNRQAPAALPHPVEAQSKSPMIIDLDSSPPPLDDSPVSIKAEPKPMMAPFPDMGTGLPETSPDVVMKDEPLQLQQDTSAGPEAPDIKLEAGPLTAPLPDPSTGDQVLDSNFKSNGLPEFGDSAPASNFTNMQFDLAPPPTDTQGQQGQSTQDSQFDLSTLANTANSSNDMVDLDSFLSASLEQTNAIAAPSQPASNEQARADQKQGDGNSNYDVIFNADGTPADGMDFDFGLDNGMGEDTFDDLIGDRGDADDNYGTMEHGEFDATFFGLDQPNDT